MGKLFTIPPAAKAVTQQALDDLITELGKSCLLLYPPKPVACGCTPDPVGLMPGNAWESGGPVAFGDVCPTCGGTGFRMESVTETIKMGVAVSPRHFYRPFPAGVRVPDGTIQTKCFLSDAPRVRQAGRMVLQPDQQGSFRWEYVLDSDPTDISNIIQGRYAVAQWKRVP